MQQLGFFNLSGSCLLLLLLLMTDVELQPFYFLSFCLLQQLDPPVERRSPWIISGPFEVVWTTNQRRRERAETGSPGGDPGFKADT